MTTQFINETTLDSIHPDIAERTSLPKVIYSLIILLLGAFSLALIFEVPDRTSAISMALMVTGSSLLLIGIFRLFWRTKEKVYLPSGSVTKEQSLFFDIADISKLQELVEKKQLVANTTIKSNINGLVRMNIILAEDNKFAAVQLCQFVPYMYVPITQVSYFVGKETEAIANFISQSKKK